MPQMKPILWLLMLSYTILLFLSVMSSLYFFLLPTPPTLTLSPLAKNPLKWNWKW